MRCARKLTGHKATNAHQLGELDFQQRLKEGVAELFDFGARREGGLTSPASRDLVEVGIFHFQCHGSPLNVRALANSPDLLDDWLERVARGLICENKVCIEIMRSTYRVLRLSCVA